MYKCEFELVEHSSQVLYKCQIISLENSCPHYHRDYEIIFLLKGNLQVIINGNGRLMNASDIILINSSDIHSISSVEGNNICMILQFSPNVISEEYGVNRNFYFDLNSIMNSSNNNASYERLRKLLVLIGLTIHEKVDGYQFYLKSYIYQLVGDLFSYTGYKVESENLSNNNNSLEIFKIIIEYIKTHFKEDFNVDQLCRDIGISKSTLYRTLSAISSTTFNELINFYRLEYSKDLLIRTEYSLSYIAQASGFSSDVSFFRVFKKYVGYTPSVYRANSPMVPKPTGIQGYQSIHMNEAISILKSFL